MSAFLSIVPRLHALTGPLRRAWMEARETSDWRDFHPGEVGPGALHPRVEAAETLSSEFSESVITAAQDILQGKFPGFDGQTWRVHTPPVWHRDYLTGVESATTAASAQLRSSKLPGQFKLPAVWLLSRWSHLVQLAQGYQVSHDEHFRDVLCQWLEDWRQKNPLGRGWNWMQVEEAAARLVNLVWLDALGRLPESLLDQLLPAHVWWVWRYGRETADTLPSLSALVGVLARWPQASAWSASWEWLARHWMNAVLREIAPDGRYQHADLSRQHWLLQFLLPARAALQVRGMVVPEAVEHRLGLALNWWRQMQCGTEPWPFGEAAEGPLLPAAWPLESGMLKLESKPMPPPQHFQIGQKEPWKWRLHQAATSHDDDQQLTLWIDHLAVFIDPGSGFPQAIDHNGPCLLAVPKSSWWAHRRITTPRRTLAELPNGLRITDTASTPFSVRWLLAPGWEIEPHGETWILFREGHSLEFSVTGASVEITTAPCASSYGITTTAPALVCCSEHGGTLVTEISIYRLL